MRSAGDELNQLRQQSLLRKLRTLDSPQSAHVEIDGRSFDNFSSNDYLGLANDPRLKAAFHEGIDRYGVGAGASRLVCGTLRPHVELEARLAEIKSAEAALVFSSGYATAGGIVCAIASKGDTLILDKLVHASLVDAARLSGATIRVFPHNDLRKLEKLLRSAGESRSAGSRVVVITESVFSMDGDAAPLADIVALKRRHNALLLVDEAHAFGILGPRGAGLAAEIGGGSDVDFQMGTLSKALGLSGGYVATSGDFRDLLINRARPFVYSTAPSPALAHAASMALDLMVSADGDRLRARLRQNVGHLSALLEISPPPAAILPVIVGDEAAALDAARQLSEAGILAPAIRYPTVARGTARLRITLSAAHEKESIDRLAGHLRTVSGRR